MTELVRTMKTIYRRLFLISTAVLVVEIILSPARFITAFGMMAFALLGIFSRPLCRHLARRHGVPVVKHDGTGWLGEDCDLLNVAVTFLLSCMATAFFFGLLYACFVPRIE